MMTRFRVRNFKALRDVELVLTPFHALIGPNDSGKTSLLEALAVVCRSVDMQLDRALPASGMGRNWSGETIHKRQPIFISSRKKNGVKSRRT